MNKFNSVIYKRKKINTLIKNTHKKLNNKFNDTVFPQLIAITNNINEFDLDINIIKKIIIQYFNK